jgi:hypothetical protein
LLSQEMWRRNRWRGWRSLCLIEFVEHLRRKHVEEGIIAYPIMASDYLLRVESFGRLLWSSRSTCSVARSKVDSEALFLEFVSFASVIDCHGGDRKDG